MTLGRQQRAAPTLVAIDSMCSIIEVVESRRRNSDETISQFDQTAGSVGRRRDACVRRRSGKVRSTGGSSLPHLKCSSLSRQGLPAGKGDQPRIGRRNEDPPHLLPRLSVRSQTGREGDFYPQSSRLRFLWELAASLLSAYGLR